MIPYPAELTLGRQKEENSELVKFFRIHGWDFNWDFDKTGYWYNIRYGDKTLMQIEDNVSVTELIKTIKEHVPAFNENNVDPSELKCIADYTNGSNFYIWEGPSPRWKGALKSEHEIS
jgi:hypothetical protein